MKIKRSKKIVRQLLHVGVAGSILSGQVLPATLSHDAQVAVNLLTQKAQALEARDRDDLATQVWRQILAADPSDVNALSHLARNAQQNGHTIEAKAYLDRLHALSPAASVDSVDQTPQLSPRATARLQDAARLALEHHPYEALQIYREVFGDNAPPARWAVAYYETLAATSAGMSAAIAGLKDMVTKYPTVPEYRCSLGKLLTYTPATREAGVELLAQVSGSSRAIIEARAAWRQALLWEKENAAFAPSVQLYLARHPDPELAADTQGMREHSADHPAISAAQLASDRKLQSGYTALKVGNLASAEQDFEAASHADARSEAGLGFVAMKKHDFESAVTHLTAAASQPGAPANVRAALQQATFWQTMQRAAKAQRAGNTSAAIQLYEAAVRQMPENTDAVMALGGTLLANQQPVEAVSYLTKATHLDPSSSNAWIQLAKAMLSSGDARGALQVTASAPAHVASELSANAEFSVTQASAYQTLGNTTKARDLYRTILASGTSTLSPDVLTEVAAVALQLHQQADAIAFAIKAIDLHASGSGAQEVLFSALVSSNQMSEARRVLNNMPAEQRSMASQHIGFAQSLASLREANGDLAGALALLEPLRPEPGDNELRLRLHIADLQAKLGHGEQASLLLAELSEAHPDDISIWRSRIQILNSLKKYNEVISLTDRIPQDVAFKLGQDGDAISALAAANAAAGRHDYAVRLLDNYLSHAADPQASAQQQLQLAWLLLDVPADSGRLYQLLQNLGSDTTLSAQDHLQASDIWTTWILRSAESAQKAANLSRTLNILEAGNQQFPNNPKIQKVLAGTLLSAGDSRRALTWYANWGMNGADADDYAGAISAAIAQHNAQFANAWLQTALAAWPTNTKILTIAGEVAQAHGDLKRAKVYWQEALAQQNAASPSTGPVAPSSLMSMLVGPKAVAPPVEPTVATTASAVSPADLALLGQAPPQLHLASYSDNAVPPKPVLASVLGVSPLVSAAPGATDTSLQDKLASLESQNTPYLDSQMSFGGRNGEPGFDRLFVEQATFDASMVLAGNLRASMLLIPTFLSGGSADGSQTSLFGQQIKPSAFGPQSASGVAGEVQLSSDILGLRVGTTPHGFLVNNWVGGFRLRPKASHITILLSRDSVTDTLLSYAGIKDPVTGQISGGVMVNSASLQGQWGSAASGVYVSGGYQVLDGRNIESNTAVNGNLGTWWKVASLYGGDVTLGMNFSGMGYDHNLRYFTWGQGGYFSPQQYFLFNVPVRWTGTYGRVKYAVAGSYGVQHFTESASPYYPLYNADGLMYPALVVTGPNFSLDARLAYQMTPHWLMGAFLTANNSRDYTSAAGGVFVRYTFEEKPLAFVQAAPALPDWRGTQPFGN